MKLVIIFGIVILIVCLSALGIMLMWSWIVPDVFHGMVNANMIPAYLSFGQALKLSIGFAFLFGATSTKRN